jgi:hypothetical protein
MILQKFDRFLFLHYGVDVEKTGAGYTVLRAPAEHTKLKFVHWRGNYLEKSSPLSFR